MSLSRLVFRAGCGIRLYGFLIIDFLSTLWFILRGASRFEVLPCSLSSSFLIPCSIMITSLGKRELVYVLLVHLFVCFARISVCPVSLPLGVGG